MNILFLTIFNINNVSDRGLYSDLMRKFRDKGHNVHIICPVERRYRKPTSLNIDEGIKVLHVKTLNLQKTNVFEKGIGTLLIEQQFLKAAKRYYKDVKFDLILYSTPPITFTKVIRFFKKRDCSKSYLLLKDIFPQNAVDLGMIKENSLFHRFFKRKEIDLYKISDHIGCMSPANVEFVINHNNQIPTNIVEVNPNSIELFTCEDPLTDRDKIKNEFGLPNDTTIFIYGGNLGKPQGIDFLIEVLESNIENQDAYFLIVGSGTEFPKLDAWGKLRQPKNFRLIANLPKEKYDDLLRCCDVGLIFLDRRFTIPNFPSRILSYMERKMPVLAATDRNTDMGKIMVDNEFGLWCESGDIHGFNQCLKEFSTKKDTRIQMGNNAFEYLKLHYSVNNSYETIIKHFEYV